MIKMQAAEKQLTNSKSSVAKNPGDLVRAWRLSLIMSSLAQQQQIQNMVSNILIYRINVSVQFLPKNLDRCFFDYFSPGKIIFIDFSDS